MIEIKQLKRLKYESFDYGRYDKLRNIFMAPEFEPEDIEELELMHEKSTELPNKHCLQLLTNLTVLVLSNNKISRFSGIELAKTLPNLLVFDISNNQIEQMDDLIDLGSLEDLRILDLVGNFVCSYVNRIDMIEMLLCPKKHVKYNPEISCLVKILTAGYSRIPVARLNDQAFKQSIKDRRVIERFPEELRSDELINTVSKFNHKNTLGKYSLEACPTPRKTRLKNLEYLNREVITKLDIVRVTGFKDFKEAIEDKYEQKIRKDKEAGQQIQSKKKKFSKTHNIYIAKYMKRIKRMVEEQEQNGNAHEKKQTNSNPNDMLVQMTRDDIFSKNKVEIDPKKFSKDLWETPKDVQYKDAFFAIGIEEFKRQQLNYIEEKKNKLVLKKERIRLKRKERRQRKKKKNDDSAFASGNSEHDVDSDPEIKRLFRFKSKRVRPQMNLSNDERTYRSSESSRMELKSDNSNSNKSSQSFSSDSAVQDSPIRKLSQQKINAVESTTSAADFRKKLQSLSQKRESQINTDHLQLQSKQSQMNKRSSTLLISKQLEHKQLEHKASIPNIENPIQAIEQPQPQINNFQVQQNELNQDIQQVHTQDAHNFGPSVISSYGQVGDTPVLNIQQFRMGQTPIQSSRIVSSNIREQTRSTFNLKNKLSSQHQVISTRDVVAESDHNLHTQVRRAQVERQELDEIYERNSTLKRMDKMGKQERPVTCVNFREMGVSEQKQGGVSRGKNFWKDMERVKITGDLSKTEFTKIQIPLESLIVSVEQGVPEELRVNFLFDENNDKYKELVHYRKVLEESRNIREAAKEMDQKIQIQGIKVNPESQFKASDFNTVFEYLQNDPTFKIQNSYDPGNQIVTAVLARKKQQQNTIPQKQDKLSTFQMREIVYGANDYDCQKEKKIVEKEILQQLDEEKGLTVEQRIKMYKWLEILDDIQLKEKHTDDKRIQRIEKKEIEKAQSFAHLAYHYSKLKKYVPEDKLQKYVKLMGIPLDEIIQENEQNTKIQTSKSGQIHKTVPVHIPDRKQRKKDSQSNDMTRQLDHAVSQKSKIIIRQKSINLSRINNLKAEMLDPNGYMAQNHPNIINFVKDRDKTRSQVIRPPVTFEEMMDQNLRRIQDQFIKKGGTGLLSVEDQMMRYAQEFNEKVKNRERLKANIKQYIGDTQQKLDEFWQWEASERIILNDKTACFRRYVKLVREGQIKVI